MKSISLVLLCASLTLGGCADYFSAQTEVDIPIYDNGKFVGFAHYKSGKEQTDFHAESPDGWKVSTSKAATAEQAIVESSKATQQALGLAGQLLKMAPVPVP